MIGLNIFCFVQAPAVASGSFPHGLSARCQDGLPLKALGSPSLSLLWPQFCSFPHHYTDASSILPGKEQSKHQLPASLRHVCNRDRLHRAMSQNTCSLTESGLWLVVVF